MTDAGRRVLIPYARFLECRERRIRIAAALTGPDGQLTIAPATFSSAVADDERKRDTPRFPGTDSAAEV